MANFCAIPLISLDKNAKLHLVLENFSIVISGNVGLSVPTGVSTKWIVGRVDTHTN